MEKRKLVKLHLIIKTFRIRVYIFWQIRQSDIRAPLQPFKYKLKLFKCIIFKFIISSIKIIINSLRGKF